MAVYKIFPIKDATLYSDRPLMNTGLDEITEIRSIESPISNNNSIARYVSEYSQNEINYVFNELINNVNHSHFSSSYQVYLRNFVATAENINQDLTFEIWPLAASWTNGTGYFLNSPQTTDGVSWEFRNDNLKWPTSSFGKIITASFTSDQPGGGVWYTGSIDPNASIPTTQSFNVRTEKDINADVSFVTNQWYLSGNNINRYVVDSYVTSSYFETPIDINNYGFIVKWEDSIENDVSKG